MWNPRALLAISAGVLLLVCGCATARRFDDSVTADVSEAWDVRRLADAALERFGRIDARTRASPPSVHFGSFLSKTRPA